MTIRYGSVCSGVEAASLAWIPLGWECKFVAEVEPFPCAVLQERFGASAPIHPLDPEKASTEEDRKMRESWIRQNSLLKKEGKIPNEGDFTKIGTKYAGEIDLLVGGTPCFVAGTMVLTPSGYVPIETLKVGDSVISGDGIARKVEAVGHKTAEVGKTPYWEDLELYAPATIRLCVLMLSVIIAENLKHTEILLLPENIMTPFISEEKINDELRNCDTLEDCAVEVREVKP